MPLINRGFIFCKKIVIREDNINIIIGEMCNIIMRKKI